MLSMTKAPIVWTIAGSDSGGGAGLQADLHTINALGGHGCCVVSAITAQNSQRILAVNAVADELFEQQLEALAEDLPPKVVKISLLASPEQIHALVKCLNYVRQKVPELWIVYDPLLNATNHHSLTPANLLELIKSELLPLVSLCTPNIAELSRISGYSLTDNPSDNELLFAGQRLLQLGCQHVLLKGGHLLAEQCIDLWLTNSPKTGLVQLSSERIKTRHGHGTGCVLASAISTALALDFPLGDALVIAKAYLNQGLWLAEQQDHCFGQGADPLRHTQWPSQLRFFPRVYPRALTQSTVTSTPTAPFPRWQTNHLGLYPVVDSSAWLKTLLALGINTIQLRLKQGCVAELEAEIIAAIELGRSYQAQVVINDHWQLALKHGAYAVHLGQEDLASADLAAIQQANLRLGISTHSYLELLQALQLQPSYIALGHIFATKTKQMPSKPQGIERLSAYVKLCQQAKFALPTVAIGGINTANIAQVLATGVTSVALVSAITKAADPEQAVRELQRHFQVSAESALEQTS
jgi:hydroxymethylpyrimidine kinase / phosphomethylpyrimidine kinase / thiamine-phosphate diphosphorylase